jgi:hypothetical protein
MFPLIDHGLLTKQYKEKGDTSVDTDFEDTYTNVLLIDYLTCLKEESAHISRSAMRKILPFSSTYLCETTFRIYAAGRIELPLCLTN